MKDYKHIDTKKGGIESKAKVFLQIVNPSKSHITTEKQGKEIAVIIHSSLLLIFQGTDHVC